jgi:alpha-1,3-fucosyltransferase 10
MHVFGSDLKDFFFQTCHWGDVHDFLKPPPPKTKEKFVAFFASNCGLGGAKERTDFVRELMQYMPVDSYGGCLHNKDDPKAERGRMMRWSNGEEQRIKINTISEYKFLLAFENSNLVDDYVTEKIINAWQAGTVPVYRGAPTSMPHQHYY